jgi:hypothetical protein
MITFNLTFDVRVLFFNLIFSAFCVVIFALFVFVLCVVSDVPFISGLSIPNCPISFP